MRAEQREQQQKLSLGLRSSHLGKGLIACSVQARFLELMPCSAQVFVLLWRGDEDPARFRRRFPKRNQKKSIENIGEKPSGSCKENKRHFYKPHHSFGSGLSTRTFRKHFRSNSGQGLNKWWACFSMPNIGVQEHFGWWKINLTRFRTTCYRPLPMCNWNGVMTLLSWDCCTWNGATLDERR